MEKTIEIVESKKKLATKEKIKRVITNTWEKTQIKEEPVEEQIQWIRAIYDGASASAEAAGKTHQVMKFILQEIQRKCQSYKQQDIEKGLITPMRPVVSKDEVIKLLVEANLHCVYCHDPTPVIYSYRRDPNQWTLDRINNDEGHHVDNVVICCLHCNLSRRCQSKEKFDFSQQLTNITKTNDGDKTSVLTSTKSRTKKRKEEKEINWNIVKI